MRRRNSPDVSVDWNLLFCAKEFRIKLFQIIKDHILLTITS